ncbi:hypothetical protein ACL9RF_09565 [Sphingobacterium sp. Mn56C]|uniref:hypothetical protein n=1 Tax=Sphingobacterium sp. Mn56C TaxID=3395261 RepID=UPI003BCB3CF7
MASKKILSRQLFEEFSKRLSEDTRILQSHVALVSALFYYQDKKQPLAAFQGSRSKLMRHSHIRSTATYHKRLSDLVKYGYLEYTPSWHPTSASRFRFVIVDKKGSDVKGR